MKHLTKHEIDEMTRNYKRKMALLKAKHDYVSYTYATREAMNYMGDNYTLAEIKEWLIRRY